MSRDVIRRTELLQAKLHFGRSALDLSPYATTGLRMVAVGPSGTGKTNTGLVVAEQLATQGWVSVLIDPESELASLYGAPVKNEKALRTRLEKRDVPIVVVHAKDAAQFIPYARVILEAAEQHRKPIFLMIDEGQLFSAVKRRKAEIGEASDIINQFAEGGRKRALDLFLTATRFTGSLSRTVFGMRNIALFGAQTDPTAWSALAPAFRAAGLSYADLAALSPHEFFCVSRSGIDKVRMPMASALKPVALCAPPVQQKLPSTYSQWDRAMRAMPTERLQALTEDVVALLGAVAGLSSQQMASGQRALQDELGGRT